MFDLFWFKEIVKPYTFTNVLPNFLFAGNFIPQIIIYYCYWFYSKGALIQIWKFVDIFDYT